jgi:hypothetical protein
VAQPVWEEFSMSRSCGMMQLPCDGESEEEQGQVDSEIAAVNVDLDSVDDDGITPEEEELPGEESNLSLFVLSCHSRILISDFRFGYDRTNTRPDL